MSAEETIVVSDDPRYTAFIQILVDIIELTCVTSAEEKGS